MKNSKNSNYNTINIVNSNIGRDINFDLGKPSKNYNAIKAFASVIGFIAAILTISYFGYNYILPRLPDFGVQSQCETEVDVANAPTLNVSLPIGTPQHELRMLLPALPFSTSVEPMYITGIVLPMQYGDPSVSVWHLKRSLNVLSFFYYQMPYIVEIPFCENAPSAVYENRFCEVTKQAVKALQEMTNLEITGIVDDQTWTMIMRGRTLVQDYWLTTMPTLPEYLYTATIINFRNAPYHFREHIIRDDVPAGTRVEVLNWNTFEWIHIRLDGQEGYMSTRHLRLQL